MKPLQTRVVISWLYFNLMLGLFPNGRMGWKISDYLPPTAAHWYVQNIASGRQGTPRTGMEVVCSRKRESAEMANLVWIHPHTLY